MFTTRTLAVQHSVDHLIDFCLRRKHSMVAFERAASLLQHMARRPRTAHLACLAKSFRERAEARAIEGYMQDLNHYYERTGDDDTLDTIARFEERLEQAILAYEEHERCFYAMMQRQRGLSALAKELLQRARFRSVAAARLEKLQRHLIPQRGRSS